MWIMLNDAFFSIVAKDAPEGSLLVRARRRGDIEKVFGRRHVVQEDDRGDYLFRARIARSEIAEVLERELGRVNYPNFKDSVIDQKLHDAYMGVWSAMARTQPSRPYAGSYRRKELALPAPTSTEPQHRVKRKYTRRKK